MIAPDRKDHWNKVYRDKASTSVSWYQPSPQPSLLALARVGASPEWSVIDVGGGASNLVDALLQRGWQHLTVLDIAKPALDAAKSRLGPDARKVDWVIADITRWRPQRTFDVWHDRAVFHFLTGKKDREAYLCALRQGTTENSRVIIATFALDGPDKCSGLPVERYDAEGLARQLGNSFELLDNWREEHVTPWGTSQSFTWCAFRRVS